MRIFRINEINHSDKFGGTILLSFNNMENKNNMLPLLCMSSINSKINKRYLHLYIREVSEIPASQATYPNSDFQEQEFKPLTF